MEATFVRNKVQPVANSAEKRDFLSYSRKNASSVLRQSIVEHNEAMAGRGLKYLRSFLSNVVGFKGYSAAKPILDCVNRSDTAGAVEHAKWLLSQTYETPAEQFAASQIALTVKKFPFPGTPEQARRNGLAKFQRGEVRNRHMNALFRARRLQGIRNVHMHNIQKHVRHILGEAPDFRKWTDYCGFGPGSVVGVSGQFTNLARKLLAEAWTVTPACLPYALTLAKRLPVFWELLDMCQPRTEEGRARGLPVYCVDPDEFTRRFMQRVVLVQHNKIAAVPKDANEYRIIASEPLLNQLCQMAADEEMRLHLRRFGIDLRDQTANQVLAREGSLMGFNSRCTIDLSNASGSIFIELVREVTAYCPDWFVCLNAIRAPAYIDPISGIEVPKRYHMFSSMGNGFTFPLETIIFAAICLAAHDYCGTAPDFRCYGDDLIVRQNEALVTLEILRDCGFKANADKTFIFGPFRESCGTDWYQGDNVRPVVFDTPLETVEQRIRIHNALVRLPNAQNAELLSAACVNWFPPFMSEFVRPFADSTDEAIDGRFHHGPPKPTMHRCTTYDAPAWYGLRFTAKADDEIVKHRRYNTVLLYGALDGALSKCPFAARRETILRVARFSHSGNTSSWLPFPVQSDNQIRLYDGHVRLYKLRPPFPILG
jgi:hypothetical protein